MRRLFIALVIAVPLATSVGCAAHTTAPAASVPEGTPIWDCGWRTI